MANKKTDHNKLHIWEIDDVISGSNPDGFLKNRISKMSFLLAAMLSGVIVFAGAMSTMLLHSKAASGSATMYASPGGVQSVGLGGSFSTNVRISTPGNTPSSGAVVYITYPVDKLQVQSISYGGSAYNLQLVENNSSGTLRMDRGAFPVVAGDNLFATVVFKTVKVGSAAIGFSSSSVVTSGEDDSNILAVRNGVTYNILAPVSSGGAPVSTASNPASVSTPQAAAKTQSVASNNQKQSSTKTSSGSSTIPEAANDNDQPTARSGSAENTQANPITTAVAKTASSIQIVVVDKQNKPIKNAEVTVMGETVKTDQNGVAKFSNVPIGEVKVLINYQGNKINKAVAVKGDSTTAQTPSYKLQIERNKFNPWIVLLPPLLGVLVAVVIIFGRPWLINRRSVHYPAQTSIQANQPILTPVYSQQHVPGATITPTNIQGSQNEK